LSVFLALAVGAVYARLRQLEVQVSRPDGAVLADARVDVPESLRPRRDEAGVLALLLDDSCSLCHEVREAAGRESGHTATRIVAVLPSPAAALSYRDSTSLEFSTDPEAWRALYEGYTPSLHLIDSQGRVADRRFIYADTDVAALLREIIPAGESHAR
jgi:hypothetical protein